MRKGLLIVIILALLAVYPQMTTAFENGFPSFLEETWLHRNVGQVDYLMEVVFLVAVDDMPIRLYSYGLQVPHIIEVRGYLPDVMPQNLPLLRILWDEDGDGVSDFAAEALEYRPDGSVVWGERYIVKLPMDTTRNFILPMREKL